MRIINFHCHPVSHFEPSVGLTPEAIDEILASSEFALWVLSPLDLSHLEPDDEYPYMARSFRSNNEDVARLRDRFPDKVLGFVYVDPRQSGAAETVHHWVTKEGFKGLKLYPPIGFYPDAPELEDFFRAIDELAIPILFHAGRVAVHPGLRMKYADPVYLEGVALTARRCQVIVGHAGNPWKPVTAALAGGVYSVYIDLTTSGGADPEFIAQVLRNPGIGPERLVWGSDGIWKASQRLEAIQLNLSRAGASEEEAEMILAGNAARLLGLDVLHM